MAGSKETLGTPKHTATENIGHIQVFNEGQQRDQFSTFFAVFMEHEHSMPAEETTEQENRENDVAEFCRARDSTYELPSSLPVRDGTTSEAAQIHPLSNDEESPRRRIPLRVRIGAKNRASRSSSICSTSSESSVSSMGSTSSSGSDSSQTSPISGASFFSSPPNAVTIAKASSLSTALLKSDGIEIPTSLTTFLPNGVTKEKQTVVPIPPLSTPPITPPLDHIDLTFKNTMAPAQLHPVMAATPMDPRALTIKRQAYIHTLKKMRERERRPFRHVVLLHSFLLQLRRGVTNKHCSEIGDFYSAMSAGQSTPRLDITNETAIAHQQQHMDQTSNNEQRLETKQNNKGSKPKRSLVSSIQNRILANKTQSGNGKSSSNNHSNNNSTSVSDSVSPSSSSPAFYLQGPLNAPSPTPTQFSTLKERLPLLRIPTYPMAGLDKKSTYKFASASNGPEDAPKPLSACSADTSVGRNDGSEGGNDDDYNNSRRANEDEDGTTRPKPTVIIPKRTTGRKGLIYQQQLQLQQRLQLQNTNVSGSFTSSPHAPAQPGDHNRLGFDQDQEWLHAQILGIRPRFETSTYMTIRVGPSDVITKPLISPSSIKTPPQMFALSGESVAPAGLLIPPLSPFHQPSSYTAPGLVKPSDASYFKTASPAPYQIHSHHHPMNHPRPSMSSPMPYIQNSPHPDRYLGDQANHMDSMKSNFELSKQKQFVDRKSMTGAIIAPSGLPSPPLSPTLESEEASAVTVRSNKNAATKIPANVEAAVFLDSSVSPSQGRRWVHQTQPSGTWNTQATQDALSHHGIEDMRFKNRKQQQMQMMRMRHINSTGTGIREECASEESEEDLPLALVQRRISVDILRSSA
ncbi:hypothetical protein BGZ50_003813 [Haplosporangium sp. Z 11]|nr:hypothetical protein BGZ50_003813 [Haplosporangium sp. Z 11]